MLTKKRAIMVITDEEGFHLSETAPPSPPPATAARPKIP